MTDSKSIADQEPPLPGSEYLGSWPVEILSSRVEWVDRPVERKRWTMMNISVELVARETQDRLPTTGAFLLFLCDRIPSYKLKIGSYESYASQRIIRWVRYRNLWIAVPPKCSSFRRRGGTNVRKRYVNIRVGVQTYRGTAIDKLW